MSETNVDRIAASDLVQHEALTMLPTWEASAVAAVVADSKCPKGRVEILEIGIAKAL